MVYTTLALTAFWLPVAGCNIRHTEGSHFNPRPFEGCPFAAAGHRIGGYMFCLFVCRRDQLLLAAEAARLQPNTQHWRSLVVAI